MFMKVFFSVILILSAVGLTLVHSEMLYAQFVNPDSDNSLNQDCSQSAIGKEITQSLKCQHLRDTINNDNNGICPVGYYRNSFGYCVPLLQISP